MDSFFYVDKDMKQAGPVTPDRFAELGITPETLVWRKGISEWTPAGELEELNGYFNTQPEPVAVSSVQPELQQPVHPVPQPMPSQPMPAFQPAMAHVPNYLWLAVLSVLFMLSPIGIFAIHHAAQVNLNLLRGNVDEARRQSSLALRWSLIALFVSAVVFILLCLSFGPSLYAYFSETYEFGL